MADVTVKYKGGTIAELTGGSKTLKTSGKYCEGDITVEHTPSIKIYRVNVPTAVATQYVTVVSGDPDVAAHYADEHAMVTVRKITNNNQNGTAMIIQSNRAYPTAKGMYMNCNTSGANNVAHITDSQISSLAVPHIKLTANGDIQVYAVRTTNNFGNADYIITFSW